jgi:adenylosuccinate synthase
VLDTFDEIQVCTHNIVDGTRHEFFPYDLALLGRAAPIYETMPGWKTTTSHARTFDDLPSAARAYLHRIEELTGVSIAYVSVGTKREQIIEV